MSIEHTAFEFRGKLIDFFPPDDAETPWLVRLMILRDDLLFEVNGVILESESSSDDVWRSGYFLRRMSVTLTEARAILAHEVSSVAKHPNDDVMKRLSPLLREAVRSVETSMAPLIRLRDALGGHVRPQNADTKGGCVEARVLRNHPNLEGTIRALGHPKTTSYRELTSAAVLFAWPDADDDVKIAEKLDELRDTALKSAGVVLRAADALLLRHWWRVGAINPPEGFEFGVLNDTDRESFVRVEKPKRG